MTNLWPLRFREFADRSLLFADDAGGFFKSDASFLDRYASDGLTSSDKEFLRDSGHSYDKQFDLPWTSFAYRWARRQSKPQDLNYVILVPTLRCNLACGYCQVSRVAETARGFDWSDETLKAVLAFLKTIEGSEIKIEFQGGEPLLRLDLLEAVRDFCRARFSSAQFVVCTNLQHLDEAAWAFLEADDTFISTSLDGDRETHERQRTHDRARTTTFFSNLEAAVARYPEGKISALPTVDVTAPPDFEALLESYEKYGIRSVYLRPINHQGFARKLDQGENALARWNELHADFIDLLIERNHRTGRFMEEYYFSQCLKRVLHFGADNHVDIRNPNFFAADYIVVDHDGRFYPTDEARMLSRIGRIDLSIGDVTSGIDRSKVQTLNSGAFNHFDPDCIHCAYQPFCGTDVVDDISRYGRIDLPRYETSFCGRHLAIFDKVFEVIYRQDEASKASVATWLGIADWDISMLAVHS
ncbi:His-Xaa-Ser system radical SAM maturase HxsB [Aminobacter ciceronei]|uniref:His-Xaa-Ser system radical SAM maturase HxsB n=1 Tax=Aminobacter ciceronei TaxID=150723 RepID=A0ABR6C6Q2_9HYPH|nr:His-Xaa-Ser system radical SAM maturase HxsB [Aminobacter ciceronei]MBA8906468.1 His-Xaa-Ser system radical SAM maturase HxsB [Aminobacter ciceronei]MBA9020406.1 His-Xaa-Ser system radical SAM maturase HxsB [Aminobacter ciceronei]